MSMAQKINIPSPGEKNNTLSCNLETRLQGNWKLEFSDLCFEKWFQKSNAKIKELTQASKTAK